MSHADLNFLGLCEFIDSGCTLLLSFLFLDSDLTFYVHNLEHLLLFMLQIDMQEYFW